MAKTEAETVLTLLCATQVLHETLDELQSTSIYRHSLKQAAKRLEEELTKVCDPVIKSVLPQDEEIFNLIMRGIELISKQIATVDPAVIAKVAQLIEDTKNQHDNELERLSLPIGENPIN